MSDITPARVSSRIDEIAPPAGRSFTALGGKVRFLSTQDRLDFVEHLQYTAAGSAFELDGNNDLMPVEGAVPEGDFEADSNGDLMPTPIA